MLSLLPLLLFSCHLFDDGYIENTCEGTPLGCGGVDTNGQDDTNEPVGQDDTGEPGGQDDTGGGGAEAVAYLYNLIASKSGSGDDYSYISGYAIAEDGTWWLLDGQPWETEGRGDLSTSALDIVMPGNDYLVAGNNRESTLDLYTYSDGALEPGANNPFSLDLSVAYIEPYSPLNMLYIVGGGYLTAVKYDTDGVFSDVDDLFGSSTYSGSGEARELQVHPYGDRLMVLERGIYAIVYYSIDSSSGQLAYKTAYQFSDSGSPTNMVQHPDGDMIFVRDLENGIYALGYNADSFETTEYQLIREIDQGPGLALDHAGRALYATESNSTSLLVFEIDKSDTAEPLKIRTDLNLDVGEGCRYMEISPDNTMLFVACPEENEIHVFSLDGSGIPSLLTVMEGQANSDSYSVGPLVSASAR